MMDRRIINKKCLKIGGYVSLICIIAVVTIVLLNFLVALIPGKVSKIDTSRSKVFTFTDNTVSLVKSLDEEVTLYLISGFGSEDPYIINAMKALCDNSDKLNIKYADPENYAKFLSQHGASDCNENSVLVVSGQKSKLIDYSEIYAYKLDYETLNYSVNFDFEDRIYSAVEYVSSEKLPIAYYTTANQEKGLDEAMLNSLATDNIEYKALALSNSVPEDADCLLIANPQTDYSAEQISAISTYLKNGGNVFVIYNYTSVNNFANLLGLLNSYGLTHNDGIILESDIAYQFTLSGSSLPYITYSEICDEEPMNEIFGKEMRAIFQLSSGITRSENKNPNIDITELCKSSNTSYLRPFSSTAEDFTKSEGDIGGPFSTCVLASDDNSKLVWLASDSFTDSTINSYSNGGNAVLISSVMQYLTGKTGSASEAKAFGQDLLTIEPLQKNMIAIVLIILIPACFAVCGIYVSNKRRNK